MNDNESKKDLLEIGHLANQQALATRLLADLQTAANISKQVVETVQLQDSKEKLRIRRQETWKTFATAIVPFLTVLTLFATLYIQYRQSAATERANDDTHWREILKSVLGEVNNPNTAAFGAALLDSYTEHPKYGRDANLLTLLLLTRQPSPDRFQDYIISHQLAASTNSISFLTDLDRDLHQDFLEVLQIEKNGGFPPGAPPTSLAKHNLVLDMQFLSRTLARLYKQRDVSAREYLWRDAFLMDADFTDLDLSGVDLTATHFQRVNLSGSTLEPSEFSRSRFFGTNWWDAKKISAPLLRQLLSTDFPYSAPNITYRVDPPSQADYAKRVLALCGSAGLNCSLADIKYGPAPSQNEAHSDSKETTEVNE